MRYFNKQDHGSLPDITFTDKVTDTTHLKYIAVSNTLNLQKTWIEKIYMIHDPRINK